MNFHLMHVINRKLILNITTILERKTLFWEYTTKPYYTDWILISCCHHMNTVTEYLKWDTLDRYRTTMITVNHPSWQLGTRLPYCIRHPRPLSSQLNAAMFGRTTNWRTNGWLPKKLHWSNTRMFSAIGVGRTIVRAGLWAGINT